MIFILINTNSIVTAIASYTYKTLNLTIKLINKNYASKIETIVFK